MHMIVLHARDQVAQVAKGLIDVRAHASPATVELRVVAVDDTGAVIASPVPTPPNVTNVAADRADGATIRVESDGGFPAGSAVTLTLTVRGQAVQVGPLALAGLASQDVVRTDVVGDELEIRVVGDEGDAIELSPVGEAARTAAAEALDAARVGASRRRSPTIVVDGSASFRAIDASVVARVVDVLVGIVAVASVHDVGIAVSGSRVARRRERDLPSVAGVVDAVLADAPRSSGARLATTGLVEAATDGEGIAWLLTDDVPADVAAAADAARGASAAAHVVVLAHPSLHGAASIADVPITYVDPAAIGHEAFGSDPSDMARLVRSLLRGALAASARGSREASE